MNALLLLLLFNTLAAAFACGIAFAHRYYRFVVVFGAIAMFAAGQIIYMGVGG